MKIKIEELKNLVTKALLIKYDKNSVELMLDVLMFGELSGVKSHGIMRVCSTGESILSRNPKDTLKVVSKTKLSKIIEGNGNPGMLVGALASNEVIKIAKDLGMGIVGTKGSMSSSGSLSFYLEKISKEDLIAIVLSRAPADVAPHRGLERLFGTNPVAFGIPTSNDPLIFDMATSAITYGSVARAKHLGEKIPKGVAVDSSGQMTTDPIKALEGSFLTFDNSYKGYGLAMMVEILAGVLPGASFLDLNDIGDGWGNLFIAIDPNLLSDSQEFKNKVTKFIERVRKSKSIDEKDIRIPGENKIMIRNKALIDGFADVDDKTIGDIKKFIGG